MQLDLLCAGAAKGLVEALQPAFERESGATLHATFGAVGAMREKLDAGAPCDVLVLTRAMLDTLAHDGRVVADTIAPLGRVPTGIAVRAGEPLPAIADRAGLRASLAAARRIYFPDPERATAGIHFVKVLRELGLYDALAPRLAPFPSGAVAMRALADAPEPGLIGCTQVTEILYTSGVVLVGALPAGFELATPYAASVTTQARNVALARRLAAMLTGAEARTLRERGGFVQE
jgi:molybdate transport system substrate-binding protein